MLPVGLYGRVSHGDHPHSPAMGGRCLSLLPGSNRLWLRSGRLWGTTLSAGTTHEARVWEAVGRCSYRRGDCVLRRSVDGLFRRLGPPASGFEPASTSRVLGTSMRNRPAFLAGI